MYNDTPSDPRLADFRNLGDPVLLRERGLFMAEGRLVVRRLLTESPYRTRAVLVTEAARRALADALERRPDVPVYTVPLGIVEPLTGFNIHRGCLATGERPAAEGVEQVLAARPRRVLVLEGVANPDNVGGIFRNALAFDAGAVVLDSRSADPLYRKAIRVSSGATLLVPFARAGEWPGALAAVKAAGYRLVALTPSAGEDLADVAAGPLPDDPLALLLGAEGTGLSEAALAAADLRVRIPIAPAADSLNIAVAAGIALYALGRARPPGDIGSPGKR